MKPMNLVPAVVTLCCLSFSAAAQSTGLKGRLLDRQGALITNMEIIATDAGKKEFRVVTNAEGEYSFDLPTGEYALETGSRGFCRLRIENYLVPKFNGVMTFDIVLKDVTGSHERNRCKGKTIKF